MRGTRYYVYVLRCADDSLYCGYTVDVQRRLKQHNGILKDKGAIYTSSRRPCALVTFWECKDKSAALKKEAAFKKLSKAKKEALIRLGPSEPAA